LHLSPSERRLGNSFGSDKGVGALHFNTPRSSTPKLRVSMSKALFQQNPCSEVGLAIDRLNIFIRAFGAIRG
jgi:hypothetical protein